MRKLVPIFSFGVIFCLAVAIRGTTLPQLCLDNPMFSLTQGGSTVFNNSQSHIKISTNLSFYPTSFSIRFSVKVTAWSVSILEFGPDTGHTSCIPSSFFGVYITKKGALSVTTACATDESMVIVSKNLWHNVTLSYSDSGILTYNLDDLLVDTTKTWRNVISFELSPFLGFALETYNSFVRLVF